MFRRDAETNMRDACAIWSPERDHCSLFTVHQSRITGDL